MKKEVIADLAWGVGIVVLALAASLARKLGYIDTDTVNRLVMGAIGLMVAWFGNRMPKRFVPSDWGRRVNRFGGWSMALSGLVYAGLWAFAPFEVAVVGGCGAILAGIALTIGYCLSLRAKSKAL
ncbi:ammonium transporter [Caulobacter endophyticus]|uniref:ammonium transporter n=1 Tax=Caulobacter endophyticus TaxID=2172652 RepID=UPI00240EE503|nr:ammonium transporter [Caulobacter endophyticus]MDG2529180.1 ammonium transporter [Caulobacter endophyticus]